MIKQVHFQTSDLIGVSRLGVDAVAGVTQLVEALHHTIIHGPGLRGLPASGRTTGITGLVYRSILGVNRLVGSGLDAVLVQLLPMLGDKALGRSSRRGPRPPFPTRAASAVPDAGLGRHSRRGPTSSIHGLVTKPSLSSERAAVLAALNGVLGDYLAETASPLAIPMRLRRAGQALELSRTALTTAVPDARSKIVVLVHGLCMNDRQWRPPAPDAKSLPNTRPRQDLAALLESELGYTTLHLHYNSGRHISRNGLEFAEQLQSLMQHWPVPVQEISLIGHSMGGLVSRSACHHANNAGHDWPGRLGALVFLGTPHHGAPLERGGNWVDSMLAHSPYTAPFARLGKLRSAGITDLRYGNLCDEDWQGRDRFEASADQRIPLPLPAGVDCYAIAASAGKQRGDISDRMFGDGLVPIASALGQHKNPAMRLSIPDAHLWIGYGLKHLDLLDHPNVCAQVLRYLRNFTNEGRRATRNSCASQNTGRSKQCGVARQ